MFRFGGMRRAEHAAYPQIWELPWLFLESPWIRCGITQKDHEIVVDPPLPKIRAENLQDSPQGWGPGGLEK